MFQGVPGGNSKSFSVKSNHVRFCSSNQSAGDVTATLWSRNRNSITLFLICPIKKEPHFQFCWFDVHRTGWIFLGALVDGKANKLSDSLSLVAFFLKTSDWPQLSWLQVKVAWNLSTFRTKLINFRAFRWLGGEWLHLSLNGEKISSETPRLTDSFLLQCFSLRSRIQMTLQVKSFDTPHT